MADSQVPRADPREEYTRRLDVRRVERAVRERRHRTVGNVRVLVVLAALAMAFVTFGRELLSEWWLLAPAVVFFWLGGRLEREKSKGATLSRAVDFYERALARLDGRWAGHGETGERFLDEHHLYAYDLDIFGKASLFELLSSARTRMGEEALAARLLTTAPPDAVRARREAVEELTPRLDLREDLAVLGEDTGVGVHPEKLRAWGERKPLLQPSSFRAVASVVSLLGALAIVALLTYFSGRLGSLELPEGTLAGLRNYFLFVAIIILAVIARFKRRTDRIIQEVEETAHDLDVLAGVLGRLEAERFSSEHLATLRAGLEIEGQAPSQRIKRLDRLVELIDSRHNVFMQAIGPFLLWDLHLSYAVENWRRTSGPLLRRWLEAVGEMEAISSLAAYRYENPRNVFPEFTRESPCFDGEALGHPLLPQDEVVPNDVRLGTDRQVFVVSGSNMSGKSTLLRTVGINTVLAQAGAPVRAKRLRLSPLAVGASIRIQDSLQEGTSRFYAEITRLRQIMEKASGDLPVLFLIDEFLHGTNSHDRRIGAEAIVRGLVERGAIGLVTTHDLALAHIAEALGPRGANVHFEDHLEDGRMRFDYRLRPGVVRKSNAIELMRSVGLEV